MTDDQNKNFIKQQFKNRFKINLNYYEDQYSQADGWFSWNGVKYNVELKERRFISTKYKTTIINKEKYNYLLANNGILVITFDDCFYIFKNLKQAFVKDTQIYCRTTTDFSRGSYKWSTKTELDLSKGLKYDK